MNGEMYLTAFSRGLCPRNGVEYFSREVLIPDLTVKKHGKFPVDFLFIADSYYMQFCVVTSDGKRLISNLLVVLFCSVWHLTKYTLRQKSKSNSQIL